MEIKKNIKNILVCMELQRLPINGGIIYVWWKIKDLFPVNHLPVDNVELILNFRCYPSKCYCSCSIYIV